MSDIIITAMEIIGTVAFAISGALISISCGLDIFGVVFIGVILHSAPSCVFSRK